MKKATMVLPWLIAVTALPASANTYHWELSAGITEFEGTSIYDLRGSYYFESISLDFGPYNESIFMGKQNNTRVSLGKSKIDYDWDDENDISLVGINSEWFIDDYYLEVSTQFSESDNSDEQDFEIRGGMFVGDNFLIYAGVEHRRSEVEFNFGGFTFSENFSTNSIKLGSKKIWDLGEDRYFNLESTVFYNSDFDEVLPIALSMDYYFSKSFALGVAYQNDLKDLDFNNDSGTFYASYHFNPKAVVRLSYSDPFDTGANLHSLSFTVNF